MALTKKFSTIIFLLFFTAFITSCDDGSEGPITNPGDPSNLSFEIIVAEGNSGKVTVQAQATDAILYEFDMGTIADGTGSSADGVFEYVYESTGTYTVEVKAYGDSGRFVKSQKQVSIISGEPATSGEGYVTPINYDGWDLVWNDEFGGSVLDQSSWSYNNGNGCPSICGWGNNELEYYRPENSWLEDGLLTIEARKETFEDNDYTSTKLITQGKRAFTYGRIDVRAKLPRGKGLWPAIWMLGSNITSVGWPSCGEIDIMEMVGGNGGEKTTYGTAHWANNDNEHTSNGNNRSVSDGLDQSFNVFSIIWNASEIRWLLNDVPFHTLSITGASKEAFHKPFYMILNVAVGGDWPGNPTSATEFPTQMQVDYVRVFQEQ